MVVTLKNRREIADEKLQNIRGHKDFSSEPLFDIAVRIEPHNQPSFVAKMRTGISWVFLLLTNTRVQVQYDPNHNHKVTLDDKVQAIPARKPAAVQNGTIVWQYHGG